MFGVLALWFRDVLGDIALLLPSFWICVWVGVGLLFVMILYMLWELFCDDFGMDFGVVLGSKLELKSTKKRSTRVSKIRYHFEWILDGSWTDFGSILEAKLEPSWL